MNSDDIIFGYWVAGGCLWKKEDKREKPQIEIKIKIEMAYDVC